MQPLWNRPALWFEARRSGQTQRFLVASELHVGIESQLAQSGAFLKSRTLDLAESLVADAEAAQASNLLLLGDVKHRIGATGPQERRDVPRLFARLCQVFDSVHVALGNHDVGLAELLSPKRFPNLSLYPAEGGVFAFDDQRVGFLHGHAWPHVRLWDADTILMGHTHVAARFVDEGGQLRTQRAWIRAIPEQAALQARYGRTSHARVIVFPPYNPLCGGTAVNVDGLLGPAKRFLEASSAQVVLIDGTSLGPLVSRASGDEV